MNGQHELALPGLEQRVERHAEFVLALQQDIRERLVGGRHADNQERTLRQGRRRLHAQVKRSRVSNRGVNRELDKT